MNRALLFSSTAVLAFCSAQLNASNDKGWLSLISPDRLFTYVIQSTIIAARGAADISYSALSVDAFGGRAILYDLSVIPYDARGAFGDCHVSAQQITLRTNPFDQQDQFRLRIEISGLDVTNDCFDKDEQMMLRVAGLDRIVVPTISHELTYEIGTGAASYSVYADITGLASVTVDAEFPHFSVEDMDFSYGDPIVTISSLRMTVEDRGAWREFGYFIPEEFRDPKTSSQTIQEMLDMGKQQLTMIDTDLSWHDGYDAFAASVVKTAPLFLASPTQLSLQANIDDPNGIIYSPDIFDDPRQIFEKLNPTVSMATVEESTLIPQEDLLAVFDGESVRRDASNEDLIRIGTSLIIGEGVPQNVSLGLDLLLAADGDLDPETSALIASSLKDKNPEMAYLFALEASLERAYGATPLLDDLEQVLPGDVVHALQLGFGALEQPETISLSLIRSLAQMHLDGRGQYRNYSMAYYWALMGAAAGDATSRSIANEVDTRMIRIMGPEKWAELRNDLEDNAVSDWINGIVAAVVE